MSTHQSVREIKNLAIVIGKGLLPKEIVNSLHNQDHTPLLIGIEGETEPWLSEHKHKIFSWEQYGKFSKYLKQHNINQVMFAGSMTRPKLQPFKMDIGGLMVLPQVMAFMLGGDNSLLSGLIKLFDKQNIEVIGAHEAAPDLLSTEGLITGKKPSSQAMKNIRVGYNACKVIGELDIGQAGVVVGGRVIALEGIEGTDGMLSRVADMRASGRLYETGSHGVLVKTMKPGQDMRADLPTIGPDTFEMLKKAGLKGVAIEAGHSLILAKQETFIAAKNADTFIYGISPDEDDKVNV